MSCCTIQRIKRVGHGTLSPATGGNTISHYTTEHEPCNVPLFADRERRTGVCDSCHRGWEVEGNRFASDDEGMRALAAE